MPPISPPPPSRRARRHLGLVAAAGLTAGLVAVPTGPRPAAAEDDTAVPLVSGTVLDADASPAADARVSVAAVPRPDPVTHDLRPVPVAETTTDAHGRFEVDAPLPTGRGVRSADGEVTLEVVALTDGEEDERHDSVTYFVSVDPDARARALAARTANAADPDLGGQGLTLQVGAGRTFTRDDVARLSRPDSADSAGVGSAYEPAPGSTRSATDALRVAGPVPSATPTAVEKPPSPPNCGAASGWWKFTGKKRKRYVPAQRMTNRKHSTMKYAIAASKSTAVTAAFNSNGTKYAGGLVAGLKQRSGLGLSWKTGNKRSRLVKPQWKYFQYRRRCIQSMPKLTVWFPYKMTGYSDTVRSRPPWSCNPAYRGRVSGDVWVARSHSVVWGGWFSLIGVKLDARQSGTASERLTVSKDKGERAPYFCGDNDDLSDADRVKAVKRP